MLRCFDYFRQERGLVLWRDHVKAAEKAAKKTEKEARKAGEHTDHTAEEYHKLRAETEKAEAQLDAAHERADTSIDTLKGKVDSIRPENGSESNLERKTEPTIDEFSSNYSRGFPEMTQMSEEDNKRFREELGRVIAPLDRFNDLLKAEPKVASKKLEKQLNAFREERKNFNAEHDAKFAIPDITEEGNIIGDDAKIKKDTKEVLHLLVAVRGGNSAYRSLNPEGMSTAEGEKRLKEDIASLKELEERFLKEFEVLKTLDSSYATNHEVQKVGPALQELVLTLKVKVASVIGSVENQKNAHPELFEHWKAQVGKWENMANSGAAGDKSSKWSTQAAEAYRDAIYTAYLGEKYELKRTTPGGAFTTLEDKRQTKPENSPKIDDIKTFLRSEGVLNDGNQAAFNTNLKAMPFYTGRFTKPEERTAAEQQMINQQLEGAKLPTALRSQTQYALDHPGGAILGNPLLFITLLSLIIFDGKNRTKYLGGLAAILGIEAIGGFGALGDAAKSGYESWLKPLFEGTGAEGKKFMEWIFGKKAVENIEQGKFGAIAEWMNLKKATNFTDKSAKGVWEALKSDRDKLLQAGDQASTALGNKLKDLSETDIGKFVGLPWVAAWLNGDPPDKTFSQVVADQEQKRAAAAAESARAAQNQPQPAQNQPGVKPQGAADSLPEKQAKLQRLVLSSSEKFTLDTETKTEASEAVRWVEYSDGPEKRILEVRYDGVFYKVQQKASKEAGAANGSFALWFKGEAIKDGLPAALAGYNFVSSEWKNAKVNSFLKNKREMPAGVTEIADVQPYYSNGRYNALAKATNGAIVEIGIAENSIDATEKPFTITQVSDTKGTIAAGAKSEGYKTIAEAKTFIDRLSAGPSDTPSLSFFTSILPIDRFTNIEYKEDEAPWLNVSFDSGGIRYKAFRKGDDPGEAFWVESVDQTKSGYRLYFANKAMFTENFQATTVIAQKDGGYTLGALLNGLEGAPFTKVTLSLNGDTAGTTSNDKYYDLVVETSKGTYKFTAAIGDKEFSVYDLQGSGQLGGKKFTKGMDAARGLGLLTATTTTDSAQSVTKPVETRDIQPEQVVLKTNDGMVVEVAQLTNNHQKEFLTIVRKAFASMAIQGGEWFADAKGQEVRFTIDSIPMVLNAYNEPGGYTFKLIDRMTDQKAGEYLAWSQSVQDSENMDSVVVEGIKAGKTKIESNRSFHQGLSSMMGKMDPTYGAFIPKEVDNRPYADRIAFKKEGRVWKYSGDFDSLRIQPQWSDVQTFRQFNQEKNWQNATDNFTRLVLYLAVHSEKEF